MKLEFCECSEKDAKELATMGRQTFHKAFAHMNNEDDFETYLDQAFSENEILSQLKNPNSYYLFVLWNTEKIGYFKLNVFGAQTEAIGENSMELERIYVIEEFQNKGIGKKIMEKVIELAKHQRKEFLWLGVWQKNISAIEFYKKIGFQTFGTHPYWVGNDKQTDWLMRLDLV